MAESEEDRAMRKALEGMEAAHPAEGVVPKGPSSVDPEERRAEERALQGMGSPHPSEEVRTALPEEQNLPTSWGTGHELLNHLSGGHLTSNTLGRVEREIWKRSHATEAAIAKEIVPVLATAALTTGVGRAVEAGAGALGVPALGEALTGSVLPRAAGIGGRALGTLLARTAPQRVAAQMIPGGWQGAISGALYPGAGETRGEAALRSAEEGAAIGPASRVFTAGTRPNISASTAKSALEYMRQGVPVRTSQIPGASRAAQMSARILRWGKEDHAALTRQVMKSVGSGEERMTDRALRTAQSDAESRAIFAPTQNERRLALSQHDNASRLLNGPPIHDENTGLVDPQRLHERIFSQPGGTERMSEQAQALGNPVDLGTLARGAHMFRGPGWAPHPGLSLPSAVGAVTGGNILAEHLGLSAAEAAMQHPVAATAAGAAGVSNVLAGIGQNFRIGSWQPYMNAALRSAAEGRGPGFLGNPLIPAYSQLGRQTPGTEPLSMGSAHDAIVDEAKAQDVDPALALSVAHQESRMEHRDTSGHITLSPAGALGVMQLMPKTAKELGVDPYDEAQNIHGGVKYIKQLLERYGGDKNLAVAAYNGGPGRVDAYKNRGAPLPPETTNYVKNILGNDLTHPMVTVNPRPNYFANPASVNDNPNLLSGGNQ
jgi:soluble lytic murein transglycosylase-like protein